MIERDEVFRLVTRWGLAENAEISRLWYHRDGEAVHAGRSELESTGRAMWALRERFPRDYDVLVKRFRDGRWMGTVALDRALDAFALVHTPVVKSVDSGAG